MNNLKKKKGAFTLVELIIVITILAILATIAFVSFQNYTRDARDSNRTTTLKSIEKGLQIFQINTGTLPIPENLTQVYANNNTLSYQGYIKDNVSKSIKINKTPLDPFDQTPYIYSTNSDKTKFELLGYLENQNKIGYISKTYADNLSQRNFKTLGSNIGILLNNDNSPISGTSIDITLSQSGVSYKSIFTDTDIFIGTGSLLFSNLYSRRPDLLNIPNLANLDDSLVGYWDMKSTFLSGSQILLKDYSKYGNHGNCFNGSGVVVNCGQAGPIFTNGGMLFDGINDYIEINKNVYSNDMTMIINIEPTLTDNSYHGFVGYQDPIDGKRSMNLWMTPRTNNNGGLHYWTNDATSTGMYNKYFASSIYNYYDPNVGYVNKFNIGYKRENGKLIIFSNGSKLLDQSTGMNDFYKPNNLWIGRVDNYFGGYIYSVRVYNRALTNNEITNFK